MGVLDIFAKMAIHENPMENGTDKEYQENIKKER
jgi:hypothetical protein